MGPDAYLSAGAFDAAYGRAIAWCAGLMVAGAAVAWATVRSPSPGACHPECRTCCAVGSPPLERPHEPGHPQEPAP